LKSRVEVVFASAKFSVRVKVGVVIVIREEEIRSLRLVKIPAVSFFIRWKYNPPLKLLTAFFINVILLIPASRLSTSTTLLVLLMPTIRPN